MPIWEGRPSRPDSRRSSPGTSSPFHRPRPRPAGGPAPRVCALADGRGGGTLTPGGGGGGPSASVGWDWLWRVGGGGRRRLWARAWAGSRLSEGREDLRGETAAAWRPAERHLALCLPVAAAWTPWSASARCEPAARLPAARPPSRVASASPGDGRAHRCPSRRAHPPGPWDHGGREAGVPLAPTVQRRHRGKCPPRRRPTRDSGRAATLAQPS